MNNVNDIKKNISSGKQLVQMTVDELNYIQNPVGKALYEKTNEKWKDRIKCEICNKTYTRSNKYRHNNTKYHKMYEEMNNKLRKLLFQSVN